MPPRLDLLVLIDDSGTTISEQADLTASLQGFVMSLAEAGVDLRVAFVSTSAANPLCGGPTGDAVYEARSCRSRPWSFEYEQTIPGEPADALAVGCLATCGPDADAALAEGLTPQPPDEGDGPPYRRPWLQWSPETSNLPAGVGLAEAVGCLAPQGASGCPYSTPIASLRHVLELDGPRGYIEPGGFLRHDSMFAAIVLTDEVDCSVQEQWRDDLLSVPNAFWGLDDGPLSPGICWQAGVECDELGQELECAAATWAIDGVPADDVSGQVMEPLDSLVDLTRQLWYRDRCTYVIPAPQPFFAFVTGVPPGYASGETELSILPTQDAQLEARYGVSPSCSGPTGLGFPPVRLRELGDQLISPLQHRNLYSACDIPSEPFLHELRESLFYDRLAHCLRPPTLDLFEDVPEIQTECNVSVIRGDVTIPLTHCSWSSETEIWTPPEGRDRCYVVIPADTTDPRHPSRRRSCVEYDADEVRIIASTPLDPDEHSQVVCPS